MNSMVSIDWTNSCMVLVCKGKGDKSEYTNLRHTSLFEFCSVVLVKRI